MQTELVHYSSVICNNMQISIYSLNIFMFFFFSGRNMKFYVQNESFVEITIKQRRNIKQPTSSRRVLTSSIEFCSLILSSIVQFGFPLQ